MFQSEYENYVNLPEFFFFITILPENSTFGLETDESRPLAEMWF